MRNINHRRHPRVHEKNNGNEKDGALVMSGAVALGVLAVAFLNGVGLGYLMKRRR